MIERNIAPNEHVLGDQGTGSLPSPATHGSGERPLEGICREGNSCRFGNKTGRIRKTPAAYKKHPPPSSIRKRTVSVQKNYSLFLVYLLIFSLLGRNKSAMNTSFARAEQPDAVSNLGVPEFELAISRPVFVAWLFFPQGSILGKKLLPKLCWGLIVQDMFICSWTGHLSAQ